MLEVLGNGLDSSIGVEWRFKLASLGSRLSRTRGDGKDAHRSRKALDWLVRSYTPGWVERAGLAGPAEAIRQLAPITDLPSADAANAALQHLLEETQRDAQQVSELMARPLQGLAGPPAAGEAWNEAINLAERATKGEAIAALQQALVEAGRLSTGALADRAGWNWAVSARDMVVQSIAWRAALPSIHAAVAEAVEGKPWSPVADEAGRAASAALSPVAEQLARFALVLFEDLIDPK